MPTSRYISIENAHIRFRNFSGKAGTFNAEGLRNFCVLLDEDIAKELTEDGFNVKWLEPRDPEDIRQPYLKIKVNYTNNSVPPKIFLVTKYNKTPLTEKDVSLLDYAEIESVDLRFSPYYWERQGRKGITAYLKDMYVTIVEDKFADKYRDVPDSAVTALSEDED